MPAFHSAAISLLRRPHVRTLATKQAGSSASKGSAVAYNKNAQQAAREAAGKDKSKKDKGPLRGQAIPHRLVRLVDPQTSKLTPLQPLSTILSSINRASHYVELVADKPEPIVKIIDRYLETTRAAEAAYRAREVARQNIQKEVQVSWSAAPADLTHKVDKVREELARGVRVDLVFSRKSGQPKITPQEMYERANEVLKGLEDVAREFKPREVRPSSGVLALFLESTTTATAEGSSTAAVADVEKAAEPEGPLKKHMLYPNCDDLGHVVRRARRDLAKGSRVEVVLSAKDLKPSDGQELLTVDQLQERAGTFFKEVMDVAKEWKEREYKPNAAKLTVFLEKVGGPAKGRVVIHKGPKPKKGKPGDFHDLFD
ncbi:hypothetical protein H0H87_010372 [Tephrocybe sp. NHM501043]|nr:hypothetical protein H0H87_010372 [Tephrocybe sp. NHM501043]